MNNIQSIDDKLKYLLSEFNILKETHPILAGLWINYLSIKKEKLQRDNQINLVNVERIIYTINQGFKTLDNIRDNKNNYKNITKENLDVLLWLCLYS